jgi:hypothetical protein
MKILSATFSFITLSLLVCGAHLERRAPINPVVDSNPIEPNPGKGGSYPRTATLKDGSILAVRSLPFFLHPMLRTQSVMIRLSLFTVPGIPTAPLPSLVRPMVETLSSHGVVLLLGVVVSKTVSPFNFQMATSSALFRIASGIQVMNTLCSASLR